MRLALAALLWAASLGAAGGAVLPAWQPGQGYRSLELQVPTAGHTGFTSQPSSLTGVVFTNVLSEAHANENRILEDGSGVALGDVDGDGWCDIYLCRLDGPNALYRNLGGWKFQEVTAAAGVACEGQFSTGALFGDLDGDGDLDLLVNGVGVGTRCFFNDGQGHFTESTTSGLVRKYGSTSLGLADVDGDGDLDLYVANYRTDTIRDAPPGVKAEFFRAADGRVVVEPAERFLVVPKGNEGVNLVERGEPDFLYLNDGKGAFTAVSWTGGAFRDEDGQPLRSVPLFWGLSVALRDLNEDGAPDIAVCNDFNYSPDQIWINDGKGHFQALPRLAMRQMSWSAMSADFADINRDGHLDFIVVEMLSREHQRRQTQRMNFRPDAMMLPFGVMENRPEYMRNTLFLNRGDQTFAEIAQFSGVDASEWTWSVIFLDVDLDGYEDLLMANGSGHDILDSDAGLRLKELDRSGRANRQTKVLSMFAPLHTANLAFRNRGDLTFAETGREWGFDLVGISNAMALGDLDNDGDLDVVLNNLNGPATLYRNNTSAARVAVRLRGSSPNTRGVGAQIRVRGGPVPQSQELTCSGRYLSCDETERVFAAGTLSNELQIEVTWRDGTRTVIDRASANRLYELDQTAADSRVPPIVQEVSGRPALGQPMFEDVTALLGHRDHEEPFDDFARQPLLPKKLSQLGPGLSWFDADGDGWEDLIIGTGRGGRMTVLQNQGGHGFKPLQLPLLATLLSRDQTTILGWHPAPGATVLLAGSANYEDGLAGGACVRQFNLASTKIDDTLPGQPASTGPLALADIDGDGDLDLFVGGRVIPGRYPEAASSLLFRNEDGKLTLDSENSTRLARVGLVSGALFSDLDNDGYAELILACEWGPVRLFKNDKGQLREVTRLWGLEGHKGWWNGVTAGDFNSDGLMDIAASNWGRNSKYENRRSGGLHIVFGDLQSRGTVDCLEAYVDPTLGKLVPWRTFEVISTAMPFVRERFSTFQAFGNASVQEILGQRAPQAQQLEAAWLDSTIFVNRSNRFEPTVLPVEAQLAPAFGIAAADFDGDGQVDLFLSQNFFPAEMETSRYDAGRGLLLKGQGNAHFQAVPGPESGVTVYGEQRGCAVADYDKDGRLDLAVSQNANSTRLFRNATGNPGLQVRLRGSAGNPQGVGAVLRLRFSQHWGPAFEIHCGSGYWSQDSARCVLATPEPPSELEIRWPGGRVTVSQIPPGARSVEVDGTGALRVDAP